MKNYVKFKTSMLSSKQVFTLRLGRRSHLFQEKVSVKQNATTRSTPYVLFTGHLDYAAVIPLISTRHLTHQFQAVTSLVTVPPSVL